MFQVVNFFANDCQRFLEVAAVLPMAVQGPLTAIVGTIYCVLYIGPWALLGAMVILLYFPYQVPTCLSYSINIHVLLPLNSHVF